MMMMMMMMMMMIIMTDDDINGSIQSNLLAVLPTEF